jgi:hypothetical protein
MSDTTTSQGGETLRPLPEPLRQALRRDPEPVRPLLAPGVRLLLVVGAALLAGAALVAVKGVRVDRELLGPVLLWAPAFGRLAAGVFLIHLALRAGVPGAGPSRPVRWAALAGAPVLFVVLTEWVAREAAAAGLMVDLPPAMARHALGCYPMEILVALPGVLLAAWLLARAYPLRPVVAATLGGLGAGLLGDATLHLVCPLPASSHVLTVHGGALLTLAVASALLGWIEGIRRRSGGRL